MKRLVVSAVEPSGERLAAELVAALRARAQVEVRGTTGEGRLPGLVPVPPSMGVVEVLGHLRALRHNRRVLLEALDPARDVLLTVDAPDFHLPLARAARARGVKVVGWVSPQVWAWRPGRVGAVAAAMDRLLCLFAFEPALYAGTGLDVRWVGHPAVDRVGPSRREPGVVAIFPGSRPAEVRRHLAPFVEAALRLRPEVVLVGAAPGVSVGATGVQVVPGAEALARAERALTKSGTVTLEIALAGIPAVVAHRVHPLTWWIGRLLVRGVTRLALPNLLLGRDVQVEVLQHLDVDRLAAALRAAREPPVEALRELLGPPGAAGRAADAVLDLLT